LRKVPATGVSLPLSMIVNVSPGVRVKPGSISTSRMGSGSVPKLPSVTVPVVAIWS
jgi:hypothetical protein